MATKARAKKFKRPSSSPEKKPKVASKAKPTPKPEPVEETVPVEEPVQETETEQVQESVEEAKEEMSPPEETPSEESTPEMTENSEEKMEESESIMSADEVNKKSGMVRFIMYLLVLVIFAGGVILAYMLGLQNGRAEMKKVVEAPIPEQKIIPTPTPEKVKLTDYSIEVLNGSGIPGQAGVVKTLLTDEGFKVGEIGNADATDYQKTVVKSKSKVSASYLQKLQETLQASYSLANQVVLDDSESSDIVIIVGSKKAVQE